MVYVVNYLLSVKVIVGLIESGIILMLMFCIIIFLLIIVMFCYELMFNIMVFCCGVKLVFFDFLNSEFGKLKYDVIVLFKEKGLVKSGDSIILIYGDEMEKVGVINIFKIVEVE